MQPGGNEAGLQSYLRSVLSQQGAHAVPYPDPAKYQIEEQLIKLRQVFPTLSIRLSDYHTNDGRLLHLLKADGTIPIHYQGNKYNIPIVVWITERFPSEAPLAYVVPTQTMVIKAGHPQVDRNGQMSQLFGAAPPLYSQPPSATPSASAVRPTQPPPGTVQPPPGYPGFSSQPPAPAYPPAGYPQSSSTGSLGNARPNSFTSGNSVADMAGSSYSWSGPPAASAASSIAAANPLWGPAYLASQQTQQPRPSFANPPPPGMAGGLGGSAGGGGGPGDSGAAAYPGYPPVGFGRPPQPPPPPPAPARVTAAELGASFRPLALRALSEQVDAAQRAWTVHISNETNALLEDQRVLTDHKMQLQSVVAALKAEREGTEGLVSEMGSKQAQLVAWLDRNEPKAAAWKQATQDGQNVDWERVLVPTDDLSKQAMETQAIDHACEDAVLALDKALHAGLAGLTLDQYLKQVRLLCRKQFFARAMGLKVAEMQRQMPPPPRAAPYSGVSNPVPMVHGDTWLQPLDAARAALANQR